MLLTQRAIVESSRLLVLYAALQTDIEARGADAASRQKAGELLAFLIPIAKGMVTELAQECVKEALQVYGGHGYIGENGMEQFVRDARIITLYEGTTGIQAADLLGRKILQLKGMGFRHFLAEIERSARRMRRMKTCAASSARSPAASRPGANSPCNWPSASRPIRKNSAPPPVITSTTRVISRWAISWRAARRPHRTALRRRR